MIPSSFLQLPPDSEVLPNLLLVGLAPDALAAIEPAARSLGSFGRIVSLDLPAARFNELESAYREAELHIDDQRYCLIVVVDLRRERPDFLVSALNSLVQALAPLQVFCFVLEPPTGMPFRNVLDAIGGHVPSDVGGVTVAGDVDACLRHLRIWCAGADGLAPLVRLRYPKSSSLWIRKISHDYMGNAVNWLDKPLRTAGVEDEQREIDFWQNTIRNTLVFAHDHKPGRSRPASTFEQETASFRQVNSVPSRLVVPQSLAGPLAGVGLRAGEDLVAYTDAASCAEVVQKASREASLVLLHEPDMPVPALAADAVAPHLPRLLLVSSGYALPWARWNRLLASNVLGAYTEEELLARIDGGSLARVKRGTWSAFAFRPLPKALAYIRDLMTETLTRIEPHLEPRFMDAIKRKFTSCILQVYSAEGLYFGWEQSMQ